MCRRCDTNHYNRGTSSGEKYAPKLITESGQEWDVGSWTWNGMGTELYRTGTAVCGNGNAKLSPCNTLQPGPQCSATDHYHRSPFAWYQIKLLGGQMQKCFNNLFAVVTRMCTGNGLEAKLSPINCDAWTNATPLSHYIQCVKITVILIQRSSAIRLEETSFSEGLITTFLNSTEQFSAFHTATEKNDATFATHKLR